MLVLQCQLERELIRYVRRYLCQPQDVYKRQSLFVVPNHLTEQWAAEFLQLYPAANILVATKKDFEIHLVTVAGIHVEPMGIYGGKQDSLAPIVG